MKVLQFHSVPFGFGCCEREGGGMDGVLGGLKSQKEGYSY